MKNRGVKRNAGFTLVELLVVVAIVGILAGFGYVAVVQQQKSSKLTENDEIAREIFVAAQNHLTESYSTGEWQKLYSDPTTNSSFFGETFDQTSANDGVTVDSSTDHDFRVFYINGSDDVATYLTSTDGSTEPISALQIMLPLGSIDDTVRSSGHYCVEYDAVTGTVYGVYYSDETSITADSVADIDGESGRTDSSVRESYGVGYYGGAYTNAISDEDTSSTGSSDTSTTTDENVPDKADYSQISLEIVNGPRLLLLVTNPTANGTQADLDNCSVSVDNLTLHDSEGYEVQIKSDADYEDTSTGLSVYILDSVTDSDKHFIEQFCSTSTESSESSSLTVGSDIYATANLSVTSNSDTSVGIVLSEVKSNTCNSLYGDDSDGTTASIENARHLENLSENISGCTTVTDAVLASDITFLDDGNSDVESFLGEIQEENDTYNFQDGSDTFNIYLIDTASDGSIEDRPGADNTYYGIVNSSLTTFDGGGCTLSDFTIEVEPESTDSTVTTVTNAGLFAQTDHNLTISDVTLDTFSVCTSGEADSAAALIGDVSGTSTSFQASNITIQNSTVGTDSIRSTSSGLVLGSAESGSVVLYNCEAVGTNSVYGAAAGGLVGKAERESTDDSLKVSMVSCSVTNDDDGDGSMSVAGTEYAGGIAGLLKNVSSVSMKDCSVTTDDLLIPAASSDEATVSAGGLIGSVTTDKDYIGSSEAYALTISSCSVETGDNTNGSFSISASGNAGGLIGELYDTYSNITASSVVGGKAGLVQSDQANAGGFVGLSECPDTTYASYTDDTASVLVQTNASGSGTFGVGGFAGKVENANFTSCYSAGRTYETSYNNGDPTVEYYDRNVYAAAETPSGTTAAGGFIGYGIVGEGEYLTIDDSFSTCSVYNADTAGTSSFAGGLIGYCANTTSDQNFATTNSYCTGLVGAAAGYAGIFIGGMDSFWPADFTGGTDSTLSCSYLLGIDNQTEEVCGYLGSETEDYTLDSIQDQIANGVNSDLTAESSATTTAFDSDLQGNTYPYKALQDLNSSSTVTTYVGDWPVVETDEIVVDKSFYTVNFLDSSGNRLVAPVFVAHNEAVSSSVVDYISAKRTEAESKVGENFQYWIDSSGNEVDVDAIFTDLETNEEALTSSVSYTAVATENPDYLTFNYIDPTTGEATTFGTSEYDSTNGATMPTLPEIADYVSYKWYVDEDCSTEITPTITDDGKFKLPDGIYTSNVYLTYQAKTGGNTYRVTVELRANSEAANYPLVYGRYTYDVWEGSSYNYEITLPTSDELSGLTLTDTTLKLKTVTTDSSGSTGFTLSDVSDGSSLDRTNNKVTITGSEATTYVVLYDGASVNYTITQVFENTAQSGTTDDLTFSSGSTNTVTTTLTGTAGSFIDLSSYKDIEGFTASGANTLYLQSDASKNAVTITYSRNQHILKKDSGGVAIMKPVRLYYGQSLWGTSSDTGLLTYETEVLEDNSSRKTGYSLSEEGAWKYQTTDADGNTQVGDIVSGDATMPDDDVTVVANWTPNATASYVVEIWQQKVDQEVDTERSTKTSDQLSKSDYDFYGTFTVDGATTGEEPAWLSSANTDTIVTFVETNITKSVYENDFEYFDLNLNATTGFNAEKKVAADGTTVYGIYFDRKIITLSFMNDPDAEQTVTQDLYTSSVYTAGRGRNQYYYSYVGTSYSTQLTSTTEPTKTEESGGYNQYVKYSGITNTTLNLSNAELRLYDADSSTDSWVYNSSTGLWEYVRTTTESIVITYTGLYGQTLPEEAQNRFDGKNWYQQSGWSRTYLTMLVSFIPPSDGTTITLYFDSYNTDDFTGIRHYTENLDGTVTDAFDTKSNGGSFTITDKYYGYDAYGYVNTDGNFDQYYFDESTLNRVTSDPVTYGYVFNNWYGGYDYYGILNIFHRRETFDIYLENFNSTTMDIGKDYQIDGTVIDQDPERYSSYVFNYDENYNGVRYGEVYGDLTLPTTLDAATYMPASLDKYGDTTGYTFGGWYTSADFSTELDLTDTMPAHSIQLYAKWIAPTYTVTYHVGDTTFTETVSKYDTISYTTNDSLPAENQVDGYTLDGWYTSEDLADENEYINSTEITENINLYAKMVPAEGSTISITVNYIQDNTDQSQTVLGTDTFSLTVGDDYTIGFKDFDGAIPSGDVLTGTVTADMADQTYELHYIPDLKDYWTYTTQNLLQYTDITNSSNTLTVDFNESTSATTNADAKVVYGAVKEGYIADSYSVIVSESSPNAVFTYSPDYDSLMTHEISMFYGDFIETAGTSWAADLFDQSNLTTPDGYSFTYTLQYTDASGNSISSDDIVDQISVGDYTVTYTLYLTNGTTVMPVYQTDVTLQILKQTVIMASGDLKVIYDGSAHSLKGVQAIWVTDQTDGVQTGFVKSDFATYSDFASYTDVGTYSNTFKYTLGNGVNADNYDIQLVYGTISIVEATE